MPPSYARPTHNFQTPRLILRTATPDDARPFSLIRKDPLNNPYGGVMHANRSEAEQRQKLAEQIDSTARGDNAFMVIVLKSDGNHELKVHDGILIGMTGMNTFQTQVIDGKECLVGDTGALIDHRFARKGYALEALEAIVECGFELGCDSISVETNAPNVPFKGVMKALGLDDVQQFQKGKVEEEDSVLYLFGKERWDVEKEGLKKRGKWLL